MGSLASAYGRCAGPSARLHADDTAIAADVAGDGRRRFRDGVARADNGAQPMTLSNNEHARSGPLAIRVSGLGKRYRLGEGSRVRSLREALAEAARRPWRRGRRTNAADDIDKQEIWSLKDVSFDVPVGAV